MKTPGLFLGISFFLFTCVAGAESAITATSNEALNRASKIIQTTAAQYPFRMLNEGVREGEVVVSLHISAEAKLVDHLIIAYTHQAFADEVEKAVPKWKFEPAIRNGQPVDAIVSVTVHFEVSGVMLVQRYGAEALAFKAQQIDGYVYQACSLKKLDRLPTPINVVNPSYPQEWAEKGIIGEVAVGFYIDETGKTRLPVVDANVNPMLASIAVSAVQQWVFSPPTCNGKPVLVLARQVFTFGKNNKSLAVSKP